MTHTTGPVLCPHCDANLGSYQDVLTMTRISGMVVVACRYCRKLLGVLPPQN